MLRSLSRPRNHPLSEEKKQQSKQIENKTEMSVVQCIADDFLMTRQFVFFSVFLFLLRNLKFSLSRWDVACRCRRWNENKNKQTPTLKLSLKESDKVKSDKTLNETRMTASNRVGRVLIAVCVRVYLSFVFFFFYFMCFDVTFLAMQINCDKLVEMQFFMNGNSIEWMRALSKWE